MGCGTGWSKATSRPSRNWAGPTSRSARIGRSGGTGSWSAVRSASAGGRGFTAKQPRWGLPQSQRECRPSSGPPADLTEIGRLYGLRNWVEQSYKQAKQELGWADFQVRQDRAIRRHWELVCCAFCFCWWARFHGQAAAVGTSPEPEGMPAELGAARRSDRNRALVWAAELGGAKLQAGQAGIGLGRLPGPPGSGDPAALGVGLLCVLLLLVGAVSRPSSRGGDFPRARGNAGRARGRPPI